MEEAVTLIRQLWTGKWVNHQGRYYPVEQARLYDIPSPPVPIYVSAMGSKSMTLAGKIGDGLISFTELAALGKLRIRGKCSQERDPREADGASPFLY